MNNISVCFQMHVPSRLKRYRFFEIGQDHYYYDDMQTEETVEWLVSQSYMPLCLTLLEMTRLSKRKFRFAIAVTGTTLDLFEQYKPEMIDVLKQLADTGCMELVAMPYSYSLSAEYSPSEWEEQVRMQRQKVEDMFGLQSQTLWNTELTFSDDIAMLAAKMGLRSVMTEGAKHILSWKSANYIYSSAPAPKLKLLLRNMSLSDTLSFHFSDPSSPLYPMDAEKFVAMLGSGDEKEQIACIWMGAETFGILQHADTGVFDFLKAIPYFALEHNIGFLTPSEASKMPSVEALSVPFTITWAGESKDISIFNGNDLQQEALQKLYAVSERVHLTQDKQLKEDWLLLQDASYLQYMNHIVQGRTPYDSAYDAFINYMNIIADFLQRVDEQYPTSIENEELNSLLLTIRNQEKEIAELKARLSKKTKNIK